MKYLIPLFDGFMVSQNSFEFCAGGKYLIKDYDCFGRFFSKHNNFVGVINSTGGNIVEVKSGFDHYIFLSDNIAKESKVYKIKVNNQEFVLSVSNKLIVTIEDKLICEENVDNLNFSHYETIGEYAILYFEGKRNYLMVIKNQEVIFSSFYDECNILKDEKYFMGRVYDTLNHGKVCHIKDKKVETYLVYCDNLDMELKIEFIGMIFLDCVKVKNFSYLENLVSDLPIKEVCEFLPKFDYYYPVSEKKFILLNKNALAGILEFEIHEDKISNVTILD